MSKSIMYVGVDVGKSELSVALPGYRVRQVAFSGSGLLGLVRWLRHRSGRHQLQVCMEATGIYSRRLAQRLLREPDIQVSIINPAQIKAFRQVQLRRTKTDGVDAAVILAYAESQRPPVWQPGSLAQEELAALVKEADRLRRLLKQSLNRREHSDGVPRVVTAAERALQGCLRKQIAVIEKSISSLCVRDDQLHEQVGLLCTIPGVGPKSATQILSYGGMPLQERSARELTAHAGLAPQHRLSGSSVRGRSRLCKQGDRRLRTALYMPALVAVRANPLLKQTYERLVKRGKAKKLALAACMRKLLVIIRAMLHNKCAFDPEWALT